MRSWLCVFALLLSSCGNEAGNSLEQRSTATNELELPTKQPNGAALTAAYCDTEKAQQIYGNHKGCVMVACDRGNKASCEMAQSYATSLGPENNTVTEPRKSTKLERMDYSKARKIIVGLGWKPTPGECIGGGVDDETCQQFPEIGNCSGTGMGFCDMHFTRRNRCLRLVTIGGSPDGVEDGEPWVRDVEFYRAPCMKDPNEGRR